MTTADWLTVCGMFLTIIISGVGGLVWVVKSMTRVEVILNIVRDDLEKVKNSMTAFSSTCFTREEAHVKLSDAKKEHEAMWKRIDACKKWLRQLFFDAGKNLDDKDF